MEWWTRLHPAWKAAVTLFAAMALGATLSGWSGLPGQVESNTSRIETLERAMQRADARWGRVLCHLEEQRKEQPAWERCQ